jgi:prepilin-type processing-associated H-X9-DG protein/prepilin-type N-terminal cleavage/methylation domain-containing protein
MRKKAFTLIELLVVLAIIAMLTGILLPSLKQARGQARSMLCQSKLKQCALAALSYTVEHNGYFPMAYWHETGPTGHRTYAWDFITLKEWTDGRPISTFQPGILWQYGDTMEIQQCPAFRGEDNAGGEPYTGYNYNTSYIGHGSGESIPQPAKAVEVRSSGTTALFGDGQYGEGANKFMRAPWANPGDLSFVGRYAGTQGFRHNGKTNIAFCDGHVGSQRECYTETYPEDKALIAEGTGFLSRDNSMYDLK